MLFGKVSGRGLLLAALVLCLFIPGTDAHAKSVVPKSTYSDGLRYFPIDDASLFEMRIVYPFGMKDDPPVKNGLTSLALSMLKKGTKLRNENEIAKAMDSLAGGIGISAEVHQVTFSAYGLESAFEEVFSLLTELIEQPAFPSKPFERMKRNRLEQLSRIPEGPSRLGDRAAQYLTFNGSPFAKLSSPQMEDLQKTTIQDLAPQYAKIFQGHRPEILILGGEAMKKRLKGIQERIGKFSCKSCGAQAEVATIGSLVKDFTNPLWVVPTGLKNVTLIEGLDSPEAYCVFQAIGPKRMVPEYYSLRVAEAILGGYFLSRLNQEIREKRSLTYSIDGDFEFGLEAGSIEIAASIKTENVSVFLNEVSIILQNMVSLGVTEKEVEMAKQYLIGAFPLNLQNKYSVASSFFEGILDGLPKSFLDDFTPKIEQVSVSDVNTALKKYVDPAKFVVVVVGDKEKLIPQLRKQKFHVTLKPSKIFL